MAMANRLGTLVFLGAALAAAPPTLAPVDEGPSNPAFFSFRAQLLRTVVARDVGALLAVVDPHIKNSFGGDDGIDEFKTMWELETPGSPVWEELGAVLALGGTFAGPHTFVAPYVFSRWPQSFDAFEHVAAIGSGIRVRAQPTASAETIGSVSFAILRLAPGAAAGDEAWTAVLLDGRTGYIASRLVRSPVAFRAFFSDVSGQWRVVMFLAGD
jgi:hypothetical protein